ncbi:EF-hand domain-containing protein [Sphingomonas sp.]
MTKIKLVASILFASLPTALFADAAHAQSGDQMATMLARADTNRDGAVSRSEFAAARTAMFDRLDRNNDGYVDSRDRPRLMGSRFDQAYGALLQADANGDRRISRAELRDAPAPGFDAADTDQDGVLSADEIAAIRSSR